MAAEIVGGSNSTPDVVPARLFSKAPFLRLLRRITRTIEAEGGDEAAKPATITADAAAAARIALEEYLVRYAARLHLCARHTGVQGVRSKDVTLLRLLDPSLHTTTE